MREEDLEELYLLVQGAPYANSVIDARMSLAQKDLATTLDLLESARERYRQSHRKTLRQDIGEVDEDKKGAKEKARRLKQQQNRCRHVLAAFDDTIAILERMMKLRWRKGSDRSDRYKGYDDSVVVTARIRFSPRIRDSLLKPPAIGDDPPVL